MSRAIVLSLEDVAVLEVMRLVQAGLVKPGRITPRGAVVHELTPAGVDAFEEFCRQPDAALALEAHGETCPLDEELAAWRERGEEIGHILDAIDVASLPEATQAAIAEVRELLAEDRP